MVRNFLFASLSLISYQGNISAQCMQFLEVLHQIDKRGSNRKDKRKSHVKAWGGFWGLIWGVIRLAGRGLLQAGLSSLMEVCKERSWEHNEETSREICKIKREHCLTCLWSVIKRERARIAYNWSVQSKQHFGPFKQSCLFTMVTKPTLKLV